MEIYVQYFLHFPFHIWAQVFTSIIWWLFSHNFHFQVFHFQHDFQENMYMSSCFCIWNKFDLTLLLNNTLHFVTNTQWSDAVSSTFMWTVLSYFTSFCHSKYLFKAQSMKYFCLIPLDNKPPYAKFCKTKLLINLYVFLVKSKDALRTILWDVPKLQSSKKEPKSSLTFPDDVSETVPFHTISCF